MNTSLFSFDPSLLQQAITEAVSTAVREVLAEQKPAAPTAPPPDLLSRAETRQLLHVSNTTLDVREKKGRITTSRTGLTERTVAQSELIGTHSAKRTFVTILRQQGVSIESICKITGNSRRTIETYIVGTSEDAVREVRAMMT